MDATLYRKVVATLNFMAQDRPDIIFSVNRATMKMANPSPEDWIPVKRILRYLRGRPDCKIRYCWQDPPTTITGYSDSDWATCVTTRKSTSGGAVYLGAHLIRCYSKRQASIALSSGEAELYAINLAAREVLGISQLAAESGHDLRLQLYTDATAVIGMVHRSGVGRLKHVSVQSLWLQDLVGSGQIAIDKIPRERNVADYLTKHWDARNSYMLQWLCGGSGNPS